MALRFGITMREVNAVGYDEPRDALARDWPKFMQAAFPNDKWLFVPNIEEKAIDFIINWDINVLILSGGDDIGDFPIRDKTERCLLEYAIQNDIPVIAICRGLQVVHSYYGGKIVKGNTLFSKQHRASRHNIGLDSATHEVNSYHTGQIVENTLHKDFEILARCNEDGSIEAIRNKNILGMLWHPEREEEVQSWNLELIEKFLQNEA